MLLNLKQITKLHQLLTAAKTAQSHPESYNNWIRFWRLKTQGWMKWEWQDFSSQVSLCHRNIKNYFERDDKLKISLIEIQKDKSLSHGVLSSISKRDRWVFNILVEERNRFQNSFCSQYWTFYSSETVTVNDGKSYIQTCSL